MKAKSSITDFKKHIMSNMKKLFCRPLIISIENQIEIDDKRNKDSASPTSPLRNVEPSKKSEEDEPSKKFTEEEPSKRSSEDESSKKITEDESSKKSAEDNTSKKSEEDKADEEFKWKVGRYEDNLERVRNWHTYAETRNAAVITLVIAVLGVFWSAIPKVFDFVNDTFGSAKDGDEYFLYRLLLAFAIVVTSWLLVVLLIALSSYKPKYNKKLNEDDDGRGKYLDISAKDNFLYWKTIAKGSCDDYKRDFSVIYGNEKKCADCKFLPLNMDDTYSREIVSNARITRYMYDKFETALKVLKAGFIAFMPVASGLMIYMIILLWNV